MKLYEYTICKKEVICTDYKIKKLFRDKRYGMMFNMENGCCALNLLNMVEPFCFDKKILSFMEISESEIKKLLSEWVK